ncbi:nucleoside 2-deoxyribosyltransferase [Enterobacter cloacae]|uniref:nucleoside 2-deoxyribosyltransferase n=1 Tax=Enterobacter cloacae TaxID=550 RepID=UPI001E4B9834|nr:nucleoside 2-deoxyribosyltransferase [Enterobacter cloacae]MCE1398452.1 nucleoside 2-deoxyribosyltransferase [Enterobacter cloacae]
MANIGRKLNLLLISGNASVKEGTIEYKGYGTSGFVDNGSGLPPVPSTPADVRTNAVLSDGELCCEYVFSGHNCYFSINFWSTTDNLMVYLNEPPYLCSIKRYDNGLISVINSVGQSTVSVINDPMRLKVRNNAGFVTVFINDVVVLTYYLPNNGLSISFSLFGADSIYINDLMVSSSTPKAFVVMEFNKEFNDLYSEVIKPTLDSLGFEVVRADESFNNGSIIHEIITELTGASVIIADITPNNPNVYYEVGYAHALKKDVILLCNENRERLPFDLADFRTIFYKDSIAGHTQVTEKLKKHIYNLIGVNSSARSL